MDRFETQTVATYKFPALRSRTWHFVRHAVEMCAAMCIGIMVLDVAYVWIAAQVGVSNPFLRFPELSALMVAINMTLPMVAWMRFRGMAWQPIIEMSAAMVIEAMLIVLAYWIGWIENAPAGRTTTLWTWQHVLMMPAMLVPMFLRRDLYTGGMRHDQSPINSAVAAREKHGVE